MKPGKSLGDLGLSARPTVASLISDHRSLIRVDVAARHAGVLIGRSDMQ